MDPKLVYSPAGALAGVPAGRVKGETKRKPSLNLSTIHVILLGIVFTMLQSISLSRLPGVSLAAFVVAMFLLLVLGYYVMHHLPLTTSMCRLKLRLAVTTIIILTKDLKVDLWVSIIALLLVSWILSIWKAGVSFIIWCFVIWVYNLDEASVSAISNNNSSSGNNMIRAFTYFSNNNGSDNSLSSGSGKLSSFEDFGLSSVLGSTANSDINSSFKETPYFDKHYSASIGYINSLEKKLIFLEKKVSILENDKLEQNIIIHTFNHNLNEKINNLEKRVQEKDIINQKELNQMYNMLLALKRRKRIRLNILKLYIKQILLWILPTPTVVVLRGTRRIISMNVQRMRGYFSN